MRNHRDDLRVNGDRLWQQIMAMARIGATADGGSNRQALTQLDTEGRHLFIQWCREQGCSVRWDAIGNIFARRSGLNDTLPPVMIGSHLDTQPTGGKFDGVYGVLAGLEVVQCLNDNGVDTLHPIDIVVWTNEEGARFSPAMMGSGVFGGALDLQTMLAVTDQNGISVGNALRESGFMGSDAHSPGPIKASFEVHIEQGPILEAQGKKIGVVAGIQGIRWYDLTIHGKSAHAGPTPMEDRYDPFRGLHPIICGLYRLARQKGPWGRVTFGNINAIPGSRNTVPAALKLAVDIRHPDQAILDEMDRTFRSLVMRVCAAKGLRADIRDEWNLPAVKFADECIDAVRDATLTLGYDYLDMVSGAGHDSGYVAEVAPTSMIFVPCEGGLSHNEKENASKEDLTAGCDVLLHAALAMAS